MRDACSATAVSPRQFGVPQVRGREVGSRVAVDQHEIVLAICQRNSHYGWRTLSSGVADMLNSCDLVWKGGFLCGEVCSGLFNATR